MAGMSFTDYVNAYYKGGLEISQRYGISKAADELTTSDDKYFNTMYGASVFNNLNTKSDVFKLLRKEGWTQSGWRVLTDRTVAASNKGIAEGGSFGPTSASVEGDVPDIVEVSATMKEIVSPYTVTTRASLLSEADDGVKGLATFLRQQAAEAHSFYIDQMLCADPAVVAGDNMESLLRVAMDDTTTTDLGATDADMYGGAVIDRSTASAWHHGYVDHGSISGNETERPLTLSMLDQIIQNAIENGAAYGDLIFLTGYQQLTEIKQLITSGTSNATWRMALESQAPKGTNGVASEPGMSLDGRVGYYDSIPIYATQHLATPMANATGGSTAGMGPVLLLDMSNLYIKVAAPTTFLAQEDLANVAALKRNYAFMTAGELIATKFKTQGQIRGLEVSA
jgi:hypothetical protein